MATNPSYPSLRPTPSPVGSGRSTPASQKGSTPGSTKTIAKPAQDSFSNLMSLTGYTKTKQNLSLAEQQAQLEAEKQKKEEERRKLAEAQFGDAQQWDALGSRAFTSTARVVDPSTKASGAKNDDVDDLFAAFNKDSKIDNSSHYPPPRLLRATPLEEKRHLNFTNPSPWGAMASDQHNTSNANSNNFDDDDDPFGLNDLKPASQPFATSTLAPVDDDDFLGDLGKPIAEIRLRQQKEQQQQQLQQQQQQQQQRKADGSSPHEHKCFDLEAREQESRGISGANKELDRAIMQLVDYGFSPEDARNGLRQSGPEINIQAAANWLLDDAHRKAKEKAQGRTSSTVTSRSNCSFERRAAGPSRRIVDTDLAKSAANVGSSFFKTANTLWKTGQKKMQQAVTDFQQDGGDPNQPKWLRDAQPGRNQDTGSSRARATDEALALESGGRPIQSRNSSTHHADPRLGRSGSRNSSPAAPLSGTQSRSSPVPRWQQQRIAGISDAQSRMNRLKADDDEDNFSSYVSANRTKKNTTPTSSAPPTQRDELDLLINTENPNISQHIPQRPTQSQTVSSTKQSQETPPTSRKPTKTSPRPVPAIDSVALRKSTKLRLEATAHFKRGDYAKAHASYTESLSVIPAGHPLLIILLTNRALTFLKTGAPQLAVNDADEALKLIGPRNGEGESVLVQNEEGKEETRDMKQLFGKALTRKAEALEQLEKWADAGAIWQRCVETRVGGATAMRGRQRCQKALAPKSKMAHKPASTASRSKPSATASLGPREGSEAIAQLRKQNEAAAREEDEKFALSDKVDARVSAWRDGKRDNLRGLLASLDQVLWEDSGWKRIGMHELVMANKVKISYMKAIAKTHPDKLPKAASTEVRLIAGLVFTTLNESWDKFKAENGL